MKEIEEIIFKTPIWGLMLPGHHYQSQDYIDMIRELSISEPSQKKSNFGGYQTRDNINELGIFQELISDIEKYANNIVRECNGVPVKITEMWGNINTKHCYNGAHIHGGILSGVFYLKVPNNSGKLVFNNPAVRSDGHLIRDSNYRVTPENLACIFFPSWLEHYVEPNLSNEERISISFNVGVK